MRSINVQDAIVRLQKKLDHLDLDHVGLNSNYEPDREMNPQERSVFQSLWLLYDILEWYYARLDVETLTKDDPLTHIVFVEGEQMDDEQFENRSYDFQFTFANARKEDLPFRCNYKDLTGLNVVFSENTVDAIIRLGRIKCPFRFHFVL